MNHRCMFDNICAKFCLISLKKSEESMKICRLVDF